MFSITDKSDCANCGGIGLVYLEGKERRLTRCSCRGDARAARVSSVLPPLYHDARLSQFSAPLRAASENWLGKPTQGLLLLGPTGSGKTWLAAAIVSALIQSGKTVVFKSAADFYEDLRAAFSSTNADVTERAVMSKLTGVAFVVLDDLGAGSLSDHERRSTLHLLDRRLNYLRPTIVTTNLTVEQVGKLMDERIASRLGGFTRIAVTGCDRRRK